MVRVRREVMAQAVMRVATTAAVVVARSLRDVSRGGAGEATGTP